MSDSDEEVKEAKGTGEAHDVISDSDDDGNPDQETNGQEHAVVTDSEDGEGDEVIKAAGGNDEHAMVSDSD